MLDDKVWQVLAEMPAPEALAAIQEAADALDNPQAQIRNINAFFMVRDKAQPDNYTDFDLSGTCFMPNSYGCLPSGCLWWASACVGPLIQLSCRMMV